MPVIGPADRGIRDMEWFRIILITFALFGLATALFFGVSRCRTRPSFAASSRDIAAPVGTGRFVEAAEHLGL